MASEWLLFYPEARIVNLPNSQSPKECLILLNLIILLNNAEIEREILSEASRVR